MFGQEKPEDSTPQEDSDALQGIQEDAVPEGEGIEEEGGEEAQGEEVEGEEGEGELASPSADGEEATEGEEAEGEDEPEDPGEIPEDREFTIKVDGKEKKITLRRALDAAEREAASQERFQKAAEVQKQARALYRSTVDHPKEAILHAFQHRNMTERGMDYLTAVEKAHEEMSEFVWNLAGELYAQEEEDQKAGPAAKENRRLRWQIEASKAQQKQWEMQQRQATIEQKFRATDQAFQSAVAKAGLTLEDPIAKELASDLYLRFERDPDSVSPQLIEERLQHYLGLSESIALSRLQKLEPEKIPPELRSRLMKDSVAQLDAKRSAKSGQGKAQRSERSASRSNGSRAGKPKPPDSFPSLQAKLDWYKEHGLRIG